jgi:hypothetical protein
MGFSVIDSVNLPKSKAGKVVSTIAVVIISILGVGGAYYKFGGEKAEGERARTQAVRAGEADRLRQEAELQAVLAKAERDLRQAKKAMEADRQRQNAELKAAIAKADKDRKQWELASEADRQRHEAELRTTLAKAERERKQLEVDGRRHQVELDEAKRALAQAQQDAEHRAHLATIADAEAKKKAEADAIGADITYSKQCRSCCDQATAHVHNSYQRDELEKCMGGCQSKRVTQYACGSPRAQSLPISKAEGGADIEPNRIAQNRDMSPNRTQAPNRDTSQNRVFQPNRNLPAINDPEPTVPAGVEKPVTPVIDCSRLPRELHSGSPEYQKCILKR